MLLSEGSKAVISYSSIARKRAWRLPLFFSKLNLSYVEYLVESETRKLLQMFENKARS